MIAKSIPHTNFLHYGEFQTIQGKTLGHQDDDFELWMLTKNESQSRRKK